MPYGWKLDEIVFIGAFEVGTNSGVALNYIFVVGVKFYAPGVKLDGVKLDDPEG